MITRISKLLALLFSSGFSAGLLVTSIVIVDSWGQMNPAAAVDWFAVYGLTLGFVMAPLGGLAVLFSLVAFVSILIRGKDRAQKIAWLLALACTVGTMALLPIYFGEANTRFFEKTIELPQVAEEIERWASWNWVRTNLALAATVVILIALARERADT
ncbi:anthrone oxygenase family protein [Tateyamaria sp. SN3-11]|uniref:anthrone oxygenase family protein n=1 Tax=Tateyamaria sp. SN3-11 TaxID=3092147 RepID=UPI0039E79CF4